MNPEIQHPTKILVPMTEGLAWGNDKAIFQEKCDGRFESLLWRGNLLAGERMVDGKFIAWDILALQGDDARLKSCSMRVAALLCMKSELAADSIQVVRMSCYGGNLLRQVLSEGGEGVVRKEAHATYYDPMQACKKSIVVTCRVTGFSHGQSVQIFEAKTGHDFGRVALRGGKCDQVRIGSIIRVEALEVTTLGKLRQPNPCREWLVTY